MKRYVATAIVLAIIVILSGCTIPVAGQSDEASLIPEQGLTPFELPVYTDDAVLDEQYDPEAPIEEEAIEDIVDNPVSEEELLRNLAERQGEGIDVMDFHDGADAGDDYLLESETPVPTATPEKKDLYYTKVDVTNQIVTVYGLDQNGKYTQIVKQMICSTGKNATPTPLGIFNIPGPVVRWGYFPKYDVYAQYLVRIKGSILFHSVLYQKADLNTLQVGSWYNLGKKASHGCVRMLPEDCKWLYENLEAGYVVEIFEGVKNASLTKSLLPPPPPVVDRPVEKPTPVPVVTPTPELTEDAETAPEETVLEQPTDLPATEPTPESTLEPTHESTSNPATEQPSTVEPSVPQDTPDSTEGTDLNTVPELPPEDISTEVPPVVEPDTSNPAIEEPAAPDAAPQEPPSEPTATELEPIPEVVPQPQAEEVVSETPPEPQREQEISDTPQEAVPAE